MANTFFYRIELFANQDGRTVGQGNKTGKYAKNENK